MSLHFLIILLMASVLYAFPAWGPFFGQRSLDSFLVLLIILDHYGLFGTSTADRELLRIIMHSLRLFRTIMDHSEVLLIISQYHGLFLIALKDEDMFPCCTRRHEQEDMSSCATRRHVFWLDYETCLLVQQTCVLVCHNTCLFIQ